MIRPMVDFETESIPKQTQKASRADLMATLSTPGWFGDIARFTSSTDDTGTKATLKINLLCQCLGIKSPLLRAGNLFFQLAVCI